MVNIAQSKVLSMDIYTRGIAYALLDGPERLLKHATTKAKDQGKNSYLDRAEALCEKYLPDLLVLENIKGPGSKQRGRAIAIINRIEVFAKEKGIPVRKVSRDNVRFAFRGSAKTKAEIAQAIGNLFPEIKDKVPPPRLAWMSAKERMDVFDAISFALAVFFSPEAYEEIQS